MFLNNNKNSKILDLHDMNFIGKSAKFRMTYITCWLKFLSANVREFRRMSAEVQESPIGGSPIANFHGHSRKKLSSKVQKSLRHFHGFLMSALVLESLQKILPPTFAEKQITSIIKTFADFRGFAFSQIFTSLRKSAAGLFADFFGLSRTLEELRGQQKLRESVADFSRLLSTVFVRESPRSDFPRSDFREKVF